MAPSYASLAKRVHGEGDDVVIAKLDATVHKNAASKYGIQGFPSLKFFKQGSAIDYPGAREENPIYNWIQKKTGPSSKLISSAEEYEKHSSEKLSVLYYLPEGEESALNTYMGFAAGYDDIAFAHTNSSELVAGLELAEKFSLIVFRNFDEGNKIVSQATALTADQMKTLLEENRYPFVQTFDQDAANRIFGQQKTALILMTDSTDSEVVKTFQEFAKNN